MSILKGRRNYLSFDGVNDRVLIYDLSLSADHIIEIDMKINDFNSNDPVNFIISGGSTEERFYVYYDSTYQLILRIGDSGTVNTNVILPSERFLFKIQFSSTSANVYINNSFVFNFSFNYNSSESPTYLGVIYGSDYFANINLYDFKYLDNSQNIITHYDFSEGTGTILNDIVGNNDGTMFGGTWEKDITEGAPLSAIYKGSPSYALSFDGVNDYIDIGTLGNWASQNLNNFSIEMTFSFSSNNLTVSYGITNDGTSTAFNNVLNFGTEDNHRMFLRDNNNKYEDVQFEYNLNDGNKHTLTYQYDNGTSTLKIDNDIQTFNYIQSTDPQNFSDFQYPFFIGANNNRGNIEFFSQMNLYDFKIYNGDTLFLHYDMSEGSGNTLVDKAGNNNGTINGATWFPVYDNEIQRVYKGTPSWYLSFDGVNDYVIANYSNTVTQFNNNDFSFTADFVMNSSPSNNVFVITIGGNGETLNDNVLHLYVDPSNNLHIFHEYGAGTNFDWNTNFTIQIGVRYQVYFTSDISSNNYSLYVNNQFIGSQTYPTAWQVASSNNIHNFILNDNQSLSGFYHDFDIYSISAWNKIISSSEANASFDKSLNGNEVGLITYYDFQDGSGTTLTDTVGNNDGTINGATWKDNSLIYFTKTLDSIAYGNLTYRDIFENGNLIENYDFSDGTNNWSNFDNRSTFTVSNNIANVISGDNGYDGISSSFIQPQNIGDKVYYVTSVKTNSNTIRLGLFAYGYQDSHSGSGNYEILSSTFTLLSATRAPYIYEDSTINTQFYVDYLYFINLTELGIDNLTKEQIDELYNEYLFIKAYYS